MTTSDLDDLETFIRDHAPAGARPSRPTGHRSGGLTLSWYGRLDQVVASVALSPATGLACISWAGLATRDHRRVAGTLGLLADVAAFAVEAETFMAGLRDAAPTLSTTEARR